MPMQRYLYPKNWDAIAFRVKAKANWTCQNCGRKCRPTGQGKAAFAERLEFNQRVQFEMKPQRFTLTVAHLNHNPSDCSEDNLKALCSVCHLRYDKELHRQNRQKNKSLKQEAQGQLKLALQLGE